MTHKEQLQIWKQRRADILKRNEAGDSISFLAKELDLSEHTISVLIKKAKRDRLA